MKETGLKAVWGAVMGACVWLFGGVDALLVTFLVFMAIDYASGFLKALVKKELNSSTGFVGLLRKGAMVLVVVVASKLDVLLGQPVARSIACAFYIANEGISILENAADLGVPLPPIILDTLKKIKARADVQATAASKATDDPVFKPPAKN